MAIDTTKLRRIAKAATPGPWNATEALDWDGIPQAGVTTPNGALAWDDHNGDVFAPADAEFIAAFNPAVVLMLLDRIEDQP